MSFVLTNERRGGAHRTLDPRSDEITAHLNRKMINIASIRHQRPHVPRTDDTCYLGLTRSSPGKLNSNYHRRKLHEAVGVEH